MQNTRGFTLIELIAVMVVLGIVGSLSTQFIVTAVDSYREAQLRQRLLAKGRTSIEQMTRYVRSAVPNSLRVSASGQCVEFMPTVGGAFYEEQVADAENGAPLTSNISVSPFTLGLGSAEHAIIGGLSNDEIYTISSPAARTNIDSLVVGPLATIGFELPHQFVRNSLNKRVYVADDPMRFCIASGDLVLHEAYGLVLTLGDASPGGDTSTMATDLLADGTGFVLSASTEDRNSALDINLTFFEGSIRVSLNQTVFIRNVP